MSSNEKRNTQRIRTIVWEDPGISTRDANSISGLEYLRAIQKGEISPPPIARLLGYNISEIDTGLAIFELEPAEYHYNPFGTVHGGIASTLLDTTMTAQPFFQHFHVVPIAQRSRLRLTLFFLLSAKQGQCDVRPKPFMWASA